MKIGIFFIGLLFIIFDSHDSKAQSSVLSTGNWFKLSLVKEGVYCITHSDLTAMGITPATIDPRNISMYGNKSGMLPVKNNVPHVDDLKEIAISIKGESDGIFDASDTIYFYGQSQVERLYDTVTSRYFHRQNIYSDSTYYFLTIGSVAGKRIQLKPSQPAFTNTTTSYTDFEWHELDSVNFLHSGKNWFGEMFNTQNQSTRIFSFDTTNISTVDSLYIKVGLAGRALSNTCGFNITSNGHSINQSIQQVGGSVQDNYAYKYVTNMTVPSTVTSGELQLNFVSLDTSAIGWLDFFEINLVRNLFLYKSQQVFSDFNSVGTGAITRFIIGNADSSIHIWDITDPLNVSKQDFSASLSSVEFNAENDSLHSYIAFDGHSYLTPDFLGQIPNQDLHSISQAKLIIVTAPQFINEATALANFHQSHDAIQSVVATTDQIYNEYSTGAQDPVAIRDFVRQVYQRSAASNDSLKYLLLFGGGSYDFKGHLGSFSSFVPTYQSDGSLNLTQTYNTDDFYGFMDSSASDHTSICYIGIGRIPVRNSSEALVINKIMNYSSASTLGRWRKMISVIADDADGNTHFRQSDTLASRMENNSCAFDLQKIYFDAYVLNTAGPYPTYPGVTSDLENCILDGRLIINYIGHGSEHEWAHEKVLEYQFLQNVNNYNNLPLFLWPTSLFNKYDDPEDTSFGQIISMNDSGAGIASISGTRLSFSSSNYNIAQKLHSHLFEKENNQYLRVGDIFKKAKQNYYADPYVANICLLGDPALRLNYPENEVVTTAINGQTPSAIPDTLVPGQSLQIAGEIHDSNGNLLSSFTGTISILLFDQKTLHHTLANVPGQSSVQPFYVWDDTLGYITVPVVNGSFFATLILPAIIDSGSGIGKISYYAESNTTDASGCYMNFIYKNLTSGIDEFDEVKISLYPNPSNRNIEINVKGIKVNDLRFSLIDIEGRMVFQSLINTNQLTVERNSLSAGVYFYEISNKKNELIRRGRIVFY